MQFRAVENLVFKDVVDKKRKRSRYWTYRRALCYNILFYAGETAQSSLGLQDEPDEQSDEEYMARDPTETSISFDNYPFLVKEYVEDGNKKVILMVQIPAMAENVITFVKKDKFLVDYDWPKPGYHLNDTLRETNYMEKINLW